MQQPLLFFATIRRGALCVYAAFILCVFSALTACDGGPALQIKMLGGSDNPCQSPNENPLQAIRIELDIPALEKGESIESPVPNVDIIKRSKQSIIGIQGPALQKVLRHCAVDLGYQTSELAVNKITVTLFDGERVATFCGEQSGSPVDLKSPITLQMQSCKASGRDIPNCCRF